MVEGAEEEEMIVLSETEEKDDARDDAEDGSTMEGGEEEKVSPLPRWHSVYLLRTVQVSYRLSQDSHSSVRSKTSSSQFLSICVEQALFFFFTVSRSRSHSRLRSSHSRTMSWHSVLSTLIFVMSIVSVASVPGCILNALS